MLVRSARWMMLAVVVMAMVGFSVARAEPLVITGKAAKPVQVVSADEPALRKVAVDLRDYLADRYDAVAEQVMPSLPPERVGAVIVVATEETMGQLDGVDVAVSFKPDGHSDAYVLEARGTEKGPCIALIGKTASGARAAVSRLICTLINDGQTLWVEARREQHSPFIDTRLVCVAPTARRQMPADSPLADANFELWDLDRLRAYPELFGQFGFSGIQITEIRGYGHISGDYLKRAQQAVRMLAVGANDRDLFVSLDQWGDCPYVEGQALCWEDPKEHQELVAFFTDLAERYGEWVDHIYIHVGDPGGAVHGGCTLFVTPQKLTAGVLEIFRRFNPNCLGTMSTWANSSFWMHSPTPVSLKNYEPIFAPPPAHRQFGQPIPAGAEFLDATWLPKDVGIALHRYYNEDQADMLVAAGRPVDVWGWYIGDMEMNTTLTLNMSTVDNYYRDLPDKAGDQIRIQTIDLCFHGWPQIINTYIGAQKMWNPRRPLGQIEREFCVAAFGPANADAMHALYKVCENSWDYDIWQLPEVDLPHPDKLGTAAFNARLRETLAQAETVRFPAGWQPNFAFPVPVQRYLDMLTARCRLTLAYSEAKQKVQEVRQRLGLEGQPALKRGLAVTVANAQGKNLIEAPATEHTVTVKAGRRVGQVISLMADFAACTLPLAASGKLTVALYDQPGGTVLAEETFTGATLAEPLRLPVQQTAGTYYLEVRNAGDAPLRVGVLLEKSAGLDAMLFDGKKPTELLDEVEEIKRQAIQGLPELPIDPLYRQDETTIMMPFKRLSFAERIAGL